MVEGGEGSALLLEPLPLPDRLCSIVDTCSATHSLWWTLAYSFASLFRQVSNHCSCPGSRKVVVYTLVNQSAFFTNASKSEWSNQRREDPKIIAGTIP